MKVLWFSPTPVNYLQDTWAHNGGGWISSLLNLVTTIENTDLGIAFESDKYYFTHKAKNELEYQIEAEYQALRAQEASEAFDAATDTEV